MMDNVRRIGLAAAAWERLVDRASVNAMQETGGILLGWRRDDGVHIEQVIEVSDRNAGHTRYRRRHAPAQAALAEALACLPADTHVGYVGEWHSHPALVGPSFLDRCELRRISGKTGNEVALLVGAHDQRTGGWTPFGLTAARRRIRQGRVDVAGPDSGEND